MELPEKPWRGFDPNTRGKAGMHWVTTHDKLDEYDRQGLVIWPKSESGTPRLKYYLSENKGVPISDFWDDIDIINSMGKEALRAAIEAPTSAPAEVASMRRREIVCGRTVR